MIESIPEVFQTNCSLSVTNAFRSRLNIEPFLYGISFNANGHRFCIVDTIDIDIRTILFV
jgi:hypothetical protein